MIDGLKAEPLEQVITIEEVLSQFNLVSTYETLQGS
jgi:hypothetical protein